MKLFSRGKHRFLPILSTFFGLLLSVYLFNGHTQKSDTCSFSNVSTINESISDSVVRIKAHGESGFIGSGFIVAKSWNKYYVLTANHVVKHAGSTEYEVITSDGKSHSINSDSIENLGKVDSVGGDKDFIPYEEASDAERADRSVSYYLGRKRNVDLAILKFSSRSRYQPVTVTDYKIGLSDNDWVFLSGWPDPQNSQSDSLVSSTGRIFEEERESVDAKNALSLREIYEQDGYDIAYTNTSYPGMSGGALVDTCGRVVGLHAAVDGEHDSTDHAQLSYSLGFSIDKILSAIKEHDAELPRLSIQKARPEVLNEVQEEAIRTSDMLSLDSDSPVPEYKLGWLSYGNQRWRLKQYEEAVDAYERAIEKDPDLYLSHYGRGLSLIGKGDFEEAAIALDRSVEINPLFYRGWLNKGIALVQLDRNREALASFRKASELDPNDSATKWWRSTVLTSLGRHKEALSLINEVLEVSENSHVYRDRGYIHYRMKDYEDAMSDIQLSIDINPFNKSTLRLRGAIYEALDRHQEAIDSYDEALELIPDWYEGYIYRGKASIETHWTNDIKKGCGNFSNFLVSELCEGVPMKLIRTLNGKLYKESMDSFDQAVEISPERPEAYVQRAHLYYMKGTPSPALEELEKAITLNDDYAEAHFIKALVLTDLAPLGSSNPSWNRTALVELNRVIELDADNAMAYFVRGNVYYEMREHALSVDDYEKAVELFSKQGNHEGRESVARRLALRR